MTSEYSLAQIAELINATIVDDDTIHVDGIAPLTEATPSKLSFLDNPKYLRHLKETKAAAVIIKEEHQTHCPSIALVVDNPYFAYATIAELFAPVYEKKSGIHPTAVVADACDIDPSVSIGANVVIEEGVVIGENAVIAAQCYIGHGSIIGADAILNPQVVIYPRVKIGMRCIIHSGTVLGSDGFGFAPNQGKWSKISQIGGICIGDDVEIGSNTSIDCGALMDTIIGNGVKIDNLVQIGHNVKIGDHTIVAGCVAIAGSTSIGKHCKIGGGSCIIGHIEIADGVQIAGMTGVAKSLKEPKLYISIFPVHEFNQWRRIVQNLLRQDKLYSRIKKLEKSIVEKN